MHGAVGTALGGVCTLVGEPQNLLIAERAGWDFIEFFLRMAPITMPTLVAGLITCVLLEKLGWFSYGVTLPESVAKTLADYNDEQEAERNHRMTATLIVQALVGLILILSLAFHVASVGLVGLMVIVLLTAFNGIVERTSYRSRFRRGAPLYRAAGGIFCYRRGDSRTTPVYAGNQPGSGHGSRSTAAHVLCCQRRAFDDFR